MKKLFLNCTLLVAALGFSQQGAIKGNIIDKEMHNEPMLFAHVQIKDADKKTETNFHGNFEFNDLEIGTYTIVVSYAGYENIEVPLTVEADKVTKINLGMSAKQVSFDGIFDADTALKENNTTALASLPRK